VQEGQWVYPCIQGWGVFDGPLDQAAVTALKSWHVNAVRFELNEDCWLNINMGGSPYGGAVYQNAVRAYVNLLHANGIYVILSMAWNAPGGGQATGQQVMADADHAPAYWNSMATFFKNDHAVIFDLYNEPHDITWSCWRDGCDAGGWMTAGMQSLVNTVRATGATQPVLLGGVCYSACFGVNDWLTWRPNDSANQTVGDYHVYGPMGLGSQCAEPSCQNSTILPVAAQFPVITGEMGQINCAHDYVDQYMAWADANGISYIAFNWWDKTGCDTIALLTSWDGTPSVYGVGVRNHLIAVN
jgi:hypothetical protein